MCKDYVDSLEPEIKDKLLTVKMYFGEVRCKQVSEGQLDGSVG